jgi:hypothetical protein
VLVGEALRSVPCRKKLGQPATLCVYGPATAEAVHTLSGEMTPAGTFADVPPA